MESISIKTFKRLVIGVLLMIGFTTYSQVNYRKTASDLTFHFAKDEKGPTAKVGQLASLHMIIKDAQGKEIKNSYSTGKPILFPVKISTFEGDIYEAVSLMSAGDSALFKIPADSMYAKVFRKPISDELKGTDLDLNIKVFEIWDQKKREEQLRDQIAEVTPEEKKRREKEIVKLEKYIEKEQYSMKKSPKGVYYQIIKKGKGAVKPKEGNTMVLNYEGKLLDGTVFETTYNSEDIGRPVSFVLGKGGVIEGWEDVSPFLTEGDYVTMIIPSHLAFGNHKKSELIKENTPLIFDIEVMGIR